jgi:exodeoxyribonuclease VII small subunit
MPKKSPKDPAAPKFEDAMADLERIVGEMEAGELPLEKLLERYEQGMGLVQVCAGKLSEAERKVEVLTKTTGRGTLPQPAEDPDDDPEDPKDGEDNDVRLF